MYVEWLCKGVDRCSLTFNDSTVQLNGLVKFRNQLQILFDALPHLFVSVCVFQADMMFSSGVFWMGLIFIPITSLVFDVAYKVMKKVCFKTLVDEVQELEALSKDPGAVVQGKSLTERAQLLKNVFKKSTVSLYRSDSMQQNLLRTSATHMCFATHSHVDADTPTCSSQGRHHRQTHAESLTHTHPTIPICSIKMQTESYLIISISCYHSHNALPSSASCMCPLRPADGYAFSQDENGVLSQSEVIRAYDTTKQRTSEW
ncbi:Phospholipid-transporting ATPase IA [Labeo rohita]|uniref:Phospholipid-transporting ATPase IA n=1 Tax=Labeo rohita TaxID=84645 RepID=A0ABQ8M236_LABRO|nr:Phospholipid-transporting ATPase IA [Labeo rohita]